MPGDCHILHLSDLHFGADHGFRMPGATPVPGEKELELVDAVVEDLKKQRINKVNSIIISGDLMTHARWVEYGEAAFDGLCKLCNSLNLNHDKVLIVPGNHDYEWYTQEKDRWTRNVLMPRKASSEALRFGHTVHFDNFLNQFYGNEKHEFPSLKTIHLENYTLKVALLDSCKLVPTKFHEYGYLSLGQIKPLIQMFEETPQPAEVRVMVLHHHVTSVIPAEPPSDEASVSVTLDAARLIDTALPAGVSFILHGHQHYPCITRINKSYREEGNLTALGSHDTYVLSGGSASVRRPRLAQHIPNTYSVITLRDGEALVRIRQIYSDGTDGSKFLEVALPLHIYRN
jgi:3',5'-cyclic AMP phosphodiesterase CpdA